MFLDLWVTDKFDWQTALVVRRDWRLKWSMGRKFVLLNFGDTFLKKIKEFNQSNLECGMVPINEYILRSYLVEGWLLIDVVNGPQARFWGQKSTVLNAGEKRDKRNWVQKSLIILTWNVNQGENWVLTNWRKFGINWKV